MPTATPFNNLITFSRGSNATVTGSNGLIQWAPNNVLTHSEQFDNATWVKGGVSITANNAVAPDGTTTADLLTGTGATPRVYQLATLVSGVSYTATCYVKQGTSTSIGFDAININAGPVFTFATRTWSALPVQFTAASFQELADGWFRLIITFTNNTTSAGPGWYVSGNTTAWLWGAQLELGSTATTYNPTTVKNLLGFSEAFDNAAWGKTAATVITGAQANPVNGLFNAQKLMEDTSTGIHIVQQSAGIVGNPQALSFYVKAAGRSWIRVQMGSIASAYFNVSTGVTGTISNCTASITDVGSGWYRCTVLATRTANGNNIVYLASANGTDSYTGDGNSGVYIYGAQLSDSASLDPYVPTPGAAPSSTAFYGPRFDFDPVTLQPRGILIEEQRTNLATYSNTFSDASWTAIGTKNLVANSTVSPDGEVSASTLTDNSAAAYQGMAKSLTVANDNTTYTASIYVRKTTGGTSATFGFNFQLTGGTLVGASPRINTDTGVLLGGTGTVQNAGAYWRLTASVTNNTTGNTALALSVYAATAAHGVSADSSAATGSAILYGAQIEVGAFATSYIPTVASTVTRSADVATISGQNFAQWYRQDEGAIAVEGSAYAFPAATSSNTMAALSDGGTTNASYVYSFGSAGYAATTTGGVVQANPTSGAALSVNTPYKMGYAFRVNDFAFSVNGAAVGTDTSGTIPTVNQLQVGRTGTSILLNGHIRNIRFIPARAADFQLQALST